MMNRAMSMNNGSAHSACAVNMTANSAYMNAACFFSVLRLYFYFSFYFMSLYSSKRQQIS